jgi:tyrosyl-tRNA synthetase
MTDISKRLNLIKRNTVEIISEEELKELLMKKKKPVVYLGTAVTGRPHIAYFLWAIKLADFIKAGCKVKLLLADVHGAMDNTPWDVLEKRYKYYSRTIPLMFEALGVETKDLEIVKGSSFQLKEDYLSDLLKLSTFVSVHDSTKAASEVVKLGDSPKLSGLLYPLMQALDEEYLKVDIQYGGLDQRKILVFAREYLSKVGYKPRVELMTPIVPGLTGKKMSASDPKSKIDLLDSENDVRAKVNGADCIAGDSDNGIVAFARYVIMTLKKDAGQKFVIERDNKYGGNLEYDNYENLENDFKEKKLHPLDLKNAVAREINNLLSVFRKNKAVLEKLAKEGYQ